MSSQVVNNCLMSTEDAVHYITSEIDNMLVNNVIPTQRLVETPYYLLEAEYLLFDNSPTLIDSIETISVGEVDKVMNSLVIMHKKGINIKDIKISKSQILLSKELIKGGS